MKIRFKNAHGRTDVGKKMPDNHYIYAGAPLARLIKIKMLNKNTLKPYESQC